MSSRRKWEERAVWDQGLILHVIPVDKPAKTKYEMRNYSTVWRLHVRHFSPFHCLSKGCCLAKALDRPLPGLARSLNNPQKSQLTALVFASGLSISHFRWSFEVSNNHGGRAEGTVQQCTDALGYHSHFLEILSFFPQVIQCQGYSLGWGWQLAWRRGRKANKGSCPRLSSVVRQIRAIGSRRPSSIIRSTARVSCWRSIAEQTGMFRPGCWYSRGSRVWLKRGCCCGGGSGNCRSSCTSCGRRRCWRGASNKISCLNQTISTLVKNILGRRIHQSHKVRTGAKTARKSGLKTS